MNSQPDRQISGRSSFLEKTLVVRLMPALLSFGSIFIVIGHSGTSSFSYVALAGAIMLSVGLCALFIKVQSLEKEIKELKAKKKE